MKSKITPRQKELLTIIYDFIKASGYPPTLGDMRERLVVSSNQSVLDLLEKLKELKMIKKDESTARSISILPAGYKLLGKNLMVPFLGATSAGLPMEALEIVGEWREISNEVERWQPKEDVFILRINGDSMLGAGINDGDLVLVKNQKEFVSGEIVLAQMGGESTVKRFISQDKPPYVYLKPENSKYQNILFTDEAKLVGKVVSVFKNSSWQPVK